MRFLEQVFLIAYRTVVDVRVLHRVANDFYHFIAAGAALDARRHSFFDRAAYSETRYF